MHKNIRRSIAVAATATGMWALGTAAASADELPVSLPLSTPDHAADVSDVADVINGVDGDDVVGKAEGLTDTAQAKAADATADARATVRSAAAGHATDRAGLAGHTPEAGDQVTGAVEKAAGATADRVTGGHVGTPAPEAPVDYLFGPIEQLPGYGPDRLRTATPGTLDTGVDTALSTTRSTAKATTEGALTQAAPVVGQTSDAVLPPVVADVVSGVLPVVGQALGDVFTLVQGVVGEVTPFADGVVTHAAAPFVQGVTTEVQPLAYGVTGAVQPFAEGVVSEVPPLAQGLTGDAVGPFAQGVTTRVMPLAQGVGAEARPFAGGLVGTVGDDARPTVANAAYGAQGLTSVTPDYVSGTVAALPSVAPAYPVQGI
ncbi:hypothetical protein AB0N93_03505 [Streptomyces sp. NPDC091267]|uniref:hypothetical protein n=1 Tax=Streptomyces sp. NPDC091267 TaxID=3155195 RepID=UPI0034389F6A